MIEALHQFVIDHGRLDPQGGNYRAIARYTAIPGLELVSSWKYGSPESSGPAGLYTRPASGDALGIEWSLWIRTGKTWRGWGYVKPWALPIHIQIGIGGQQMFSETGDVTWRPPISFKRASEADIRITNAAPESLDPPSFLTVLKSHIQGRRGDRELSQPGRNPRPTPAKGSMIFETELTPYPVLQFSLDPKQSKLYPILKTDCPDPMIVKRIAWYTEPAGEARIVRLYGRPEWME